MQLDNITDNNYMRIDALFVSNIGLNKLPSSNTFLSRKI